MRAASFFLVMLSGCASIAPRFEQDVATTFAEDDMRRLQTPDVELYYPGKYAEAAKLVAARASECLTALRARDVTKRERRRALLFLTSANFNNAYVGGQSYGEPLHSLNPLSVTSEIFHWYGLGGADVGDIACHEMFHYAHFEQTEGLWRALDTIFGPVLPPQTFLERWFTEGLAQYYEGRLQREVGRPHSPLYRGSFDSFVAMRHGEISAGDLSLSQRELTPYSGAYLTGLHFIEWLVEKYGEDQLWSLMDVQGRSIFSPLGVTLRAKAVFGLSLGALFDAWREELKLHYAPRARPADERVILDDAGQLARLAAHRASGTLAVISSGNEQVPMLRIIEADGTVRVDKRLVNLAPFRPWVLAGPGSMSGLSFSDDGRWLFLLNDDLIDRGDTRAQLWRIDTRNGEVTELTQDLGRGMGGSISADGTKYTFVEFPAGRSRIIERDLTGGTQSTIAEFPEGVSVASPQWNPSHTLLVFSRLDANGWNLVLRDSDGLERVVTTDGAFNYGARWSSDSELVFARKAGKYLQAHRLSLETGVLERLSDTPYGLIDPVPYEGGVAAVVRDGVHWSIDRMPAEALEQVTYELTPTPEKHEPPPLKIERDEKYTSIDHLFIPQARIPQGTINFGLDENGDLRFNGTIGLELMGRDRLGRHSWLIGGLVSWPDFQANAQRVSYLNLALAPTAFNFTAGRSQSGSSTVWDASLYLSRSVWTASVAGGVEARILSKTSGYVSKYIGPGISFAWGAGDSTAYGGPSRRFTVALDATAYPAFLASDINLGDIRLALGGAIPLPFSKRHSLTLGVVGRTLPGAPINSLMVGGVSSFAYGYVSPANSTSAPTPVRWLPSQFSEGLRGFDDHAFFTQHAVTWNASYRYRFIIDRGTMSILWLLPSFLFRQIDVEAFTSGAQMHASSVSVLFPTNQLAIAAGASISARMLFGGQLPVSITYQFAWRFRPTGAPPLHVIALTFD